ncbi:MAG: amidohydrolase family protein [Sphingomonadaceae bacterium]|uniref:amidohydrolase family protein n=1 Tax=Thermaurantiacus sp. TaxID=2820283 RepID=UPI00298F2DA0|nr:amidohydrolase family protein [Thermaurantiacus sp.]MCS6986718.1 amidohydrolase family protein [Sphingomonadaceae bacterium]MDW8414019.1 amidohydrolase family protein [Thermaurantiacus sp.]
MRRQAIALLALVALTGGPAGAQERFALVGGRVVTNVGQPVDGGTVLVVGGRIERVLPPGSAAPPGYVVVDATGRWVTPGIVAGLTQLGLSEVTGGAEANDTRAPRAAVSAALDAAAAFNPHETSIPITRRAGVTTAAVTLFSGDSVFAGRGLVASLADGAATPLRARAFQYVALGQAGGRIAGGARTAAWAELLNGLEEARRLTGGVAMPFRDQHRDLRITREDAEALVPVVKGEQPLLVRVDRASDIRQVLTLPRIYPGLRVVLVSANEGWLVAREIAEARVPVITLGMENLPASFDQVAASLNNVGRLVAAGVTVALGTPDLDASFQPRLLPQYAGNLVAQGRIPGGVGLSWDQAFATITRAPADILGLPDRGRIAPGAVADLVLWTGDPLELSSWPERLWIAGREQPLETRQSLLAQRYRPGSADGLPQGYRRPGATAPAATGRSP